MKKVYQIRQGLLTDGQNIYETRPVGAVILNLNQAPVGHPAHVINSRISKSKNEKLDKNTAAMQAKGLV